MSASNRIAALRFGAGAAWSMFSLKESPSVGGEGYRNKL
jgi:hypothetical protein